MRLTAEQKSIQHFSLRVRVEALKLGALRRIHTMCVCVYIPEQFRVVASFVILSHRWVKGWGWSW